MTLKDLSYIALGPFNFFRHSVKEGVVAILIPLITTMTVSFLLLIHPLQLLRYKSELIVWGSLYWLICAILNLIASRDIDEHNYKRSIGKNSIYEWLDKNPGKTIVDYYTDKRA